MTIDAAMRYRLDDMGGERACVPGTMVLLTRLAKQVYRRSDDELLAKLRDFGLDVDRDGVERLCAGALSAEEVAGPIVDKQKLNDDMTVDWVWISLLALWQRW